MRPATIDKQISAYLGRLNPEDRQPGLGEGSSRLFVLKLMRLYNIRKLTEAGTEKKFGKL